VILLAALPGAVVGVQAAHAASSAGVENGVLRVQNGEPSLRVIIEQRDGGLLVQFGGESTEPMTGPNCARVPEASPARAPHRSRSPTGTSSSASTSSVSGCGRTST
jgi:hypothetical protein